MNFIEPKVKVIISVSVVVSVIVLWTGMHIYETTTCEPIWDDLKQKLDHIKTPNSVRTIKLFNEYPGAEYRLVVADTILITDSAIVDTIRAMVSDKYKGKWNRPVGVWHIRVNMMLDNGVVLDFGVSKIKNNNPNMTHMYFGTNSCGDDGPSYSLTLGNYLEKVTKYKGVNY